MSGKRANWKARVENRFGKLGRIIAAHPLWWLAGSLAIIVALASQLPHLRVDSAMENFLKKGSKTIRQYDEFKTIFGRDTIYVISIEAKDIFDPEFIRQLRAMHRDFEEEVPYVARVDSLINARHTYGENDTLIIEDLLPETLPDDPQKLQALKDYAYNSPAYQKFLISPDRHLTSVVIKLDAFVYEKNEATGEVISHYMEDKHFRKAGAVMDEIVARYLGTLSDDIRITGAQPISILIGEIVQDDFVLFSALANLLVGIVLWIIFRRASGVVMPLMVMMLGVVSTISMMAILDSPVSVSTSILPSFLLAVCVGDSIHLLTIFYRQYDEGVEKIDALAHALEHTGLAIFFTSITTAAGLASFALADVAPVAALGIFGAIGSMVAFFLTLIVLPGLISLLPLARKPLPENRVTPLQRALQWSARYAVAHYRGIVAVGVVLMLVALAIAAGSQFRHNPLEWLPDAHPATLAIKKHEARMGGSVAVEVMFDTGVERGVNNAEFMHALDKAMTDIARMTDGKYHVEKVMSITDVIKESNRALHDNDDAYYTIPDDSDLISQELFLVELDKPEDLYNLIDSEYRRARMSILTPWQDATVLTPMIEDIREYLQANLGPHTQEIVITGVTATVGATFAAMLQSTAESYVLAGVVITVMMILLIGNLKLGLLSMVPSLLPIVIVIALMRLMDIPLDMFNMLIGSIAIGLTVDDNVHFMHGFRRLYLKTGDPAYAIEKTLLSSGRAMLVTSIVLSIGFLIYTQSHLKNMIGFGAMTALCIGLALVASFLLGPALMMMFNKRWNDEAQQGAHAR